MKYRLTRRARRDILSIWEVIAEDNEIAADRFLDLLSRRFAMLGKQPYLGRSRDDLRSGYRSFPVGQYLIFTESQSRVFESCTFCTEDEISTLSSN